MRFTCITIFGHNFTGISKYFQRSPCTIFVIRVDVKLMVVSVNLVYFPFNGGIYNIYGAVDFPRYMTTFDSENKHNKSMINNDTRLFSTNDHKVINTG